MKFLTSEAPLTSLVYDEGLSIADVLATLAHAARDEGRRPCGLIQIDREVSGRTKCDMSLLELWSGESIKISDDRGAFARGCRLNHGALAHACALLSSALGSGADLLILNKFGRTEVEGGGLRSVIAEALTADIPVLIGLPRRNLASWREFAGEFGDEIEAFSFVATSPKIVAQEIQQVSR
jgi:hypothetical protein